MRTAPDECEDGRIDGVVLRGGKASTAFSSTSEVLDKKGWDIPASSANLIF